jgi:hypothetical protein
MDVRSEVVVRHQRIFIESCGSVYSSRTRARWWILAEKDSEEHFVGTVIWGVIWDPDWGPRFGTPI